MRERECESIFFWGISSAELFVELQESVTKTLRPATAVGRVRPRILKASIWQKKNSLILQIQQPKMTKYETKSSCHRPVTQRAFADGRRWHVAVAAVVASAARAQPEPRQPQIVPQTVKQPLLERFVLHVLVVQRARVAKVKVGHLDDEALPVLDVVGHAKHHQNDREQAEPDWDHDDGQLRLGNVCAGNWKRG